MQYFTKKIFLFIILIICNNQILLAQKSNIFLFKSYNANKDKYNTYLKKSEVTIFSVSDAKKILNAPQKNINLNFTFEDKEWVIELTPTSPTATHFKVIIADTKKENFIENENNIYHYKGKIKGNEKSFAAVSIMANKIVAVIADENGNINIGAINSSSALANNEHIIYREADLIQQNTFECLPLNTPNTNPIPTYSMPENTNAATVTDEPVDVYYEADYSIYTNNGSSITNVVNYVTALINVVNTMYLNDSIKTQISAIKVWNIPDPYVGLSTASNVLNLFANNMTNGFPGDVAHFLSQRSLGGGVAYLNVLCSINYYKTAVSGNLSNSFNQLPNYSWSVMVITHELGHNIGSPHTQSCTWPGGAIDNCYATEGGCALGPAPTNGGTVMSYCHLNVGINLANGFGPLPGARVRNAVRNSTCIYPAIYFETTFNETQEATADVANGCLPYKLVTTKLTIPYAPTQPVDVSLIPIPSDGLGIGENEDIAISTTTFTLSSTNLSQLISFKIYNDAVIENTEALSLNFDINANGGNAVKRNTSITNIQNIISDDYRPDSTIGTLLYYENFDAITSALGNWTQEIVQGNTSPNRWIIGTAGGTGFTSKAAYISNNNAALAYTGASVNDSAIVRLISPSINASGYTNMQLSFLYKCMGESIFVNGGALGGGTTYLDYGRVLCSIDNGGTWQIVRDNIANANARFTLNLAMPVAANNATNLRLAFEWKNNSTVVNQPPFIIDSVVIKGTSTSPIQTLPHPNNNNEALLKPFTTVHYYNPITKNIMATLQNNSSHNFGCTKVELIRTGTATAQAWSTLACNGTSSKAYKITTANANANAAYTLQLYYTENEINGWLNATNNNVSAINIVKTNADITAIPPSSQALFSSINNHTNFGATANAVVSATYTGLNNVSTYALLKPYANAQCPSALTVYTTNILGSNYQWQVDDGSGYINLNNGVYYGTVGSNILNIANAPTSFFNNKYRCAITTTDGIVYSEIFILKFVITWLGTASTAWENPLNWSCNMLPNDKTDVIIDAGTLFTPQVNSNTTIRSVTLNNNAQIQIKTGANLTINQ